jgi:hypothetical protein
MHKKWYYTLAHTKYKNKFEVDETHKHKTQNYETTRQKYKRKLHNIGLGNAYINMTPKTQRQQNQKSVNGIYVVNSFFTSSKIFNTEEKQPREWNPVFTNYTHVCMCVNNGLYS